MRIILISVIVLGYSLVVCECALSSISFSSVTVAKARSLRTNPASRYSIGTSEGSILMLPSSTCWPLYPDRMRCRVMGDIRILYASPLTMISAAWPDDCGILKLGFFPAFLFSSTSLRKSVMDCCGAESVPPPGVSNRPPPTTGVDRIFCLTLRGLLRTPASASPPAGPPPTVPAPRPASRLRRLS